MIDRKSRQEVDRLAERLREDCLEEADAKRLREIIRHRPRARRYLVEHLYLSAALKEKISHISKEPKEVTPMFGTRLRVMAATALALAASLAMGVWLPWFDNRPVEIPISDADVASKLDSAGIAVISRANDVKLGAMTTLSPDRLAEGEPVGAGIIDLLSGVVQIDFYSGATVVLEGPARMELLSPSLGRLEYGNLWARVPPPARGFRVESSQFDVVDLGTEFGMLVKQDGAGEVHVITGKVEVEPAVEGRRPPQLLDAGEGVQISSDGESEVIKSRPEVFLASGDLVKTASGKHARWTSFQEAFLKDPDLLVAYTFPKHSSIVRTVKNEAGNGSSSSDGSIVGCEWGDGRWPEKGALEFRHSAHRLRLNLPGRFDDLTLACWVRVDRLDSAEVALLHPETRQDRYIHWTLVNIKKGVSHLHFSETARTGERSEDRNHFHCKNNILKESMSLGSWAHLALTYNSETKKVTHFVNGEVIGENAIMEPRELSVGTADIGNWPHQEWAEGGKWEVRNLNGAIDEFMILRRASSREEIRELWQAGRP